MRTAIEALDHLVLATPDLDETSAWIAEMTGVVPSPGGQHVGKGTRNTLCSFGLKSYLEIVGPDPEQPNPAAGRPFGIDDLDAACLVAWAIAVPDMTAAQRHAIQAGYDPGEATAMQRRRTDGVLLSWQLTVAPSPAVPFLIDWLGSPHPAAIAAQGLCLDRLSAHHPRPAVLLATLAALELHVDTATGGEGMVAVLSGPNGAIRLGPT